MNKTIYDYQLNSLVPVRWFDEPKMMKVIGYDVQSNQVQVQHLDAPGSFYITPEKLEQEAKWVRNYYQKQNNLDVGGTGHGDISYSDADPGL